jgi:hypothetical protein
MSRDFNPNSEVADGGGMAEAKPEYARPRAQHLGYFQVTEHFPTAVPPTLLRPGRPHSTNAEIPFRNSGSTADGYK